MPSIEYGSTEPASITKIVKIKRCTTTLIASITYQLNNLYCKICLKSFLKSQHQSQSIDTQKLMQEQTGPKIIDSFAGALFQQKLKVKKKIVLYETLQFVARNQYPSVNIPLTIQNVEYHRKNSWSLQNTAITPSAIENELHSNQYSKDQILIIDSSHNYDTKQIPQIFKQYDVVKGFSYSLDKQTLKNSGFLYQLEHVKSQVEYQFKLGNGVYLPCFIGELDLGYLMELYQQFAHQEAVIQRINNVLKAYFLFSSSTNCPIFINCYPTTNGLGSLKLRGNLPILLISEKQKQQKCSSIEFMKSIYKSLENFLKLASQFKADSNIVVINPPILLIHATKRKEYRTSSEIYNQFEQTLCKLKDSYHFTTLFQFLRVQELLSLDHIASQINQFQQSTLLTPGVKFKTDLKPFGGKGVLAGNVFQYLDKFFGLIQQQIKMVTSSNFIDLLSWKRQKKIVIQIKYWKCDSCLKDFEQKVQAFRKHGKQFCSTKCLRSFNF